MSILTDLHHAILTELRNSIAGIKTFGLYPKLRKAVEAPAVFIDLASLEPGTSPGTGELAMIARFEARVVVGQGDEANLQVRELALEVARVIHCNHFGQKMKPAELISVNPDSFNPQLEAYEVWLIEWDQEFHVGDSVWDGEGIVPQRLFLGFAPEIGAAHEDKYIELNKDALPELP